MSRPWKRKFADAFRGLREGVRGESSFVVHFVIAAVVLAAAAALRMDTLQWCILLLCIAGVLGAEMFNSALESMAKAITHEQNPHVGGALDISSGAVLFASVGAVIIGAVIFSRHWPWPWW